MSLLEPRKSGQGPRKALGFGGFKGFRALGGEGFRVQGLATFRL